MWGPLQIGGVSVEPGQRTVGRLPVTRRASGEMLELALHILRGHREGPTLGLFGTSHGDEAYAIEIIRATLAQLNPAEVRGTILAIPVGNPVAFESFTRTTGQGMNTDKNNMNRVFPGSPDGWLTEQIAHSISSQFVPQLDYLIDYHCGGLETGIDYILMEEREGEAGRISLELSRLYGTELLFQMKTPAHGGTLSEHAHSRGIPTVVAELGGCIPVRTGYLARCVQGARNIMIHLGMLDGRMHLPAEQLLMHRRMLVRPRSGGLFIPEVGFDRLGKTVPGGTVLGRVISPHTFEELDVLRAPYDETVLIMMRGVLSRVNPGDYGYILGDRASAEIIRHGAAKEVATT